MKESYCNRISSLFENFYNLNLNWFTISFKGSEASREKFVWPHPIFKGLFLKPNDS
jgi:hypothetical protein